MNCCDDWSQCTQGANCPARAHLYTRNGGAQVNTRPHSDMPIVDMGGEFPRADSYLGICLRIFIFLACFVAALLLGCWWLRVPAWLWS